MKQPEDKAIIFGVDHYYPRNEVLFSALGEIFKENIKKAFFDKMIFRELVSYIYSNKNAKYVFIIYPSLFIKGARKNIFAVFLLKYVFKYKIIFDSFISVYDTNICDKKTAAPISMRAIYYYLLDFLSYRFADVIIFDTLSHQEYIIKKFKVPSSKQKIVLPVGVNLNLIESFKENNLRAKNKSDINVMWYGHFTPLQGMEYIIKAASELRSDNRIHFTLIGSADTPGKDWEEKIKHYSRVKNLRNITFINNIAYDKLITYIKEADICLGIFGNTAKAKRVIPNKVLDGMACGRIVITARNIELERYFEDRADIIYCEPGDPSDLAEKIIYVADNLTDLKHIGENACRRIKDQFSKNALINILNNNL